ncbi:hypothetical protein GCM10008170_17970 [Methylopila capsulata]|uniref:Uncharacterized protein n=1 Tax=Methylopila capsulata TaxID=61654 RepID=A0A9W6IT97_9HYPH|nr:hypothetical protein GCM10008170_17970 [Methylopila capsulata]
MVSDQKPWRLSWTTEPSATLAPCVPVAPGVSEPAAPSGDPDGPAAPALEVSVMENLEPRCGGAGDLWTAKRCVAVCVVF